MKIYHEKEIGTDCPVVRKRRERRQQKRKTIGREGVRFLLGKGERKRGSRRGRKKGKRLFAWRDEKKSNKKKSLAVPRERTCAI